jgi:hypothetical protein
MRLDLYVHHTDPETARRLDAILARLDAIQHQEIILMAAIDDLTAQVKATDDAEQSALVLIDGIAARLAAAGTDPEALAALTTDLKTNSDALAAAVVANQAPVPAAPPAAPPV